MSAPRVEPSQPRHGRNETVGLLMERRVPVKEAAALVDKAEQDGIAPSMRYGVLVVMPEPGRFVIQEWS